MLIDIDETWMRQYEGAQHEPDDFSVFWKASIEEANSNPLNVSATLVETELALIDVYDVTFAGYGGDEVKAWLRIPRGIAGPLPTVVTYVGYGGGRGKPEETLIWAAAGFAHLHMDSRGQGSSWSTGETVDDAPSGPQVPGVMTKGISSRETYYYRRLFVDAVRAVDAAKSQPQVDETRIAVVGGSQGGGIAIAVAGLRSDLKAVVAFVPFLCDFPRSTRITDAYPYKEIGDFLSTHRDKVQEVHSVLAYFDCVNFARYSTAPVHFSVGLMDEISPPSTVYAAYNNYKGEKQIREWAYNGHDAGGIDDEREAIAFLRRTLCGRPDNHPGDDAPLAPTR